MSRGMGTDSRFFGGTVTRRVVDVGAHASGLGGHGVAVDVFTPEVPVAQPLVLCCLPGGGMSRRYWDLTPGGNDSYSFARFVARMGHVAVAADHLGTGGSVLPADAPPPLLGRVVAANAAAFKVVVRDLYRAWPDDTRPADPLRCVGVGHSMGGLMTVRQQIDFGGYRALALLGFGTAGLPEALPAHLREACRHGPPDDDLLAAWTERHFGGPYPVIGRRPEPGDDPPPGTVARALAEVSTELLGAAGLLAMMPGNVGRDTAAVKVPVFLGVGSRDPLLPHPHDVPAAFPCAADVTLYIQEDAGHHPHVADSRVALWERLLSWAESAV